MSRRICRLTVAVMVVLSWAAQARAQGADQDPIARLIGRPILSVEIQIEGRPDTTPALLALVDIHPGDRLSPEAWRRVTARFDQVPRFEGVSVKVDERPGGVVLIFDLVPRHPIEALHFSGTPGVPIPELERQVKEQFNGLPAVERRADVEQEVRRILRNEGYLKGAAQATIVRSHDPDRSTLEIEVTAGPRALITHAEIQGKSPLDSASTLAKIGATVGAPFRERALAAELAKIRDDLRAKRFYTAIAQAKPPTVSEDGTGVSLVITIEAGPLVELQVNPKGDLPGSVDDYIPIKRQSSVDADLLETAQGAIIDKLREQGYWKAQVSFCGIPDKPCVAAPTTPTPDRLVITYTIERGRRYRIRGVDVPAGLAMTAADFQVHKPLNTDAWFDQNGVLQSMRFVQIRYQDLGFHQVVMNPTYEDVAGRTAEEGGIVVHPNITEGPKALVTSITFDLGDRPVITAAQLADLMFSKEHQPYSLANLGLDRGALLAFYESQGFLNRVATITPVPNAAGTEVTLAVVARAGPQVLVGEITVVGNDRVSRDLILREITLRTGQPYSEKARADSNRALRNLPSLKNVQISVDPRLPGETTTRVLISVEEADSRTFDIGGGLEAGTHPRAVVGGGKEDRLEFAPRASIGVGRRNLGGRDRAVNAFARVSLKPKNAPNDPLEDGHGLGFTDYRATATYSERQAFRSATNILLTLTSEQAIRTSFNFVRRVGSADFFRAVTPRVTLLGGYRLEWTRLFDELIDPKDQPLIDRLFPQVRLSIFSGAVIWDRRDNQVSPTSGGQVNANLDVAFQQLGSEVGFAKSFIQGSIFRTIVGPRRLIAAFRVELGLARGFERTALDDDGNPVVVADLPASQRFFAGGSTTVRGFQLDRLGVEEILNVDGLSNGGNGLIVANAELRAYLGKLFKRDFTLVGFVDSGNVFRRAGELDLSRLRTAVGFGVRYDSPLGPLRLDVGFKTDRMIFPNSRERRWEFHLSLGEVF